MPSGLKPGELGGSPTEAHETVLRNQFSDVAKWKVHGPVETLRREVAIWDIAQETWVEDRLFTVTAFRPDGSVSTSDFYNPDGSIAHSRSRYDEMGRLTATESQLDDGDIGSLEHFYDDAGRRVRTACRSHDGTQSELEVWTYDTGGKRTVVRFLHHLGTNMFYGIEGTEQGYPAPGAATMTTMYDEWDLPAEVAFHDGGHKLLRHVTFLRDSEGRPLSEEMHIDEEFPFPINNIPEEHRGKTVAMFKSVLGAKLSTTTYCYDAQGRLRERTYRVGALHERRTTYDYGDRDDPVSQTTQHASREAGGDDNGGVHYSPDHVTVHHNRFEYLYDAQGNWTECVVWSRLEPNPDFQRSNVERRAITYYDAT